MNSPLRFSLVGLGKLGASMAAAIANRGFSVVGVDVAARSVDRINNGLAPVDETDLERTIQANRQRLRATMDFGDAIANSDVTFVVVPTPSDDRGAFSLQHAKSAFRQIGLALADKQGYHLVVMSGTVLPGATRQGLLPLLEAGSGKEAGTEFGLCYSPEFIALGSVIRDFLNPDFTLVGELDERAGALLERSYAGIMENNPPCRRMSIENAELTKIAVNTYVTTKITFANMLAEICERIPGGDVDVVTRALGSDRRIGGHYLKGALGYGGPCFPRDNVALSFIARELGVPAALAEATDASNRGVTARVVNNLRAFTAPNARIGILGLSYKPMSHVVEESQGVSLANELARAGHQVVAYDPLVGNTAESRLDRGVTVLPYAAQVLSASDTVLITTPDAEFSRLEAADFQRGMGTMTVIDFWRILRSKLSDRAGIRYVPYGCSTDDLGATQKLHELWGETESSEPAGAT